MEQKKPEPFDEEAARIRSYLISQAIRRTPEQLVEALREAQRQFLAALSTIPDAAFSRRPRKGEWAAADILAHVLEVATLEERAIRRVLERGEQPGNVSDQMRLAPSSMTREQMLQDLERCRERLIALVLQSDPQAHLDIRWAHRMFGDLNWREWVLFARIHTQDHARQLQEIATALAATPQ